jgi:group I intron endonuclease
MNDKNFYVYCHQTKDDGNCFYIGKGKNNRAYSKYDRNIHWKNKVAKHGGFDAVILVNNISEEKAFELEVDFIKQIGIENLVNMTYGGEGGLSGFKHSDQTREKMRDAKKAYHPMFGKHHTSSTIVKMIDSQTGEKNHMFGKFSKDNKNSKPISQYTKDGEYIQTFYSARDAMTATNIHYKTISACLRGRYKTAGGFIWQYTN